MPDHDGVTNHLDGSQKGDELIIRDVWDEESSRCLHGLINEQFLTTHVKDFNAHFYVCGPDKMTTGINALLLQQDANTERVVFEK